METSRHMEDLRSKGRAVIEGLKRHGKVAAAVTALVPLGSIAVDGANAQSVRSSYVEGTATEIGPNEYRYEFTLYNTSIGSGGGNDLVVNWELPLFDADEDTIRDIRSPEGGFSPTSAEEELTPATAVVESDWFYEIVVFGTGEIVRTDNPLFAAGETSGYYGNASGPYGDYEWDWTKENDPVWQADNDVYGPNPDAWLTPNYILHWYTKDIPDASPADPIRPGDFRTGYSFVSNYGAGNTPYQASWFFQPMTIGDPPSPTSPPDTSIPLSPNNPLTNGVVPEPLTAAMSMLAGAALLGYATRRRR